MIKQDRNRIIHTENKRVSIVSRDEGSVERRKMSEGD